MLIRLSNEADLDLLADVELSAAKKFVEHLGDDASQGQHTLDHAILVKSHQNNSLWVAESEGKSVGFLCAISISDSFHIEEVSVMYEYQGLGKNLINAMVEEATKRQYSFVSLTTDSQIPWNQPFYERLGFAEIEADDCSHELKEILLKEKDHNDKPENRIAMVLNLAST